MISIDPQEKVYLCKTELENDYKNELTFASLQAQENYFNSTIFRSYTDFTYIKKDNIINVNENIDKIISCNYLFYRNDGFTDASGNIKTYYCFITGMEYVNENCTRISFETDVWQTYQFDIVYNASFVEREHTNDDTIGVNTYPEGLETGEYIINSTYVDPTMDDVFNDTCYVLGASVEYTFDTSTAKYDYAGGGSYNGVYSGVTYYYFSKSAQAGINNALYQFAHKGQADTITGLFIVPKVLAPATADGGKVQNSATPISYNVSFAKTYGLQGYTPKNNKLKTFPYCYVLCNNMAGSSNIYNYEDFSGSNCTFNVKGVLCPGASIRLTPTNYKGIASNDNESMMLGKFPICNYSVDMYTNWLTQNSVNVPSIGYTNLDAINVSKAQMTSGLNAGVGTLGDIFRGVATGGLLGGIANGLFGGTNRTFNAIEEVASALVKQKQHSLIPPSVRGDLNAGDVVTADSKNNFRFYRMSIKSEYAQKIDNFFTMFGYATNKLKVPNITGRSNWNYVKLSECNFTGDIPQQHLNLIKSVFVNGVTLWHNPSTFLDYSQDNSIVS